MEYDAIYFGNNSSTTIGPGSFYVKAAGMLYSGGVVSDSFYNETTWYGTLQYKNSTGVNVPLMYYKMFTGANNPIVSSVQVIYTPTLP
jgi:hypothetical protein